MIAAVYDRDYRCDEEIKDVLDRLRLRITFAAVHGRKEIENYLLVPAVLYRATVAAIADRDERSGIGSLGTPSKLEIENLLDEVTRELLPEIQSQYIARRQDFFKRSHSRLDAATVAQQAIKAVSDKWNQLDTRMEIVPGKHVLAHVRERIQRKYAVNITDQRIVSSFRQTDIPDDLRQLIEALDNFRKIVPGSPSQSEATA